MRNTKITINVPGKEQEFMIANQPLKCVQECVYLGQSLSRECACEKEIHRRIKMGWSAYSGRSQIMAGDLPLTLRWKCTTMVYCQYQHVAWKLGRKLRNLRS